MAKLARSSTQSVQIEHVKLLECPRWIVKHNSSHTQSIAKWIAARVRLGQSGKRNAVSGWQNALAEPCPLLSLLHPRWADHHLQDGLLKYLQDGLQYCLQDWLPITSRIGHSPYPIRAWGSQKHMEEILFKFEHIWQFAVTFCEAAF